MGTLIANSTIRAAVVARVPDLADTARIPDLADDGVERSRRIAQAERLQTRFAQRMAIHAELVACGASAVFDLDSPSPLAIGIHHAVIELLAGAFDQKGNQQFLPLVDKSPCLSQGVGSWRRAQITRRRGGWTPRSRTSRHRE